MKKILSVLLAAIMVFCMAAFELSSVDGLFFAFQANAETVNSGSCGENLAWSYDKSAKTLTISGTGEMTDYEEYAGFTYPWRMVGEIKYVVIEDGVTSIGNVAFAELTSIKSVSIPGSVTSIGYGSFKYCTSLTDITIPNGVTDVKYGAFENCTSLTNISLPESLINIDISAFDNTGYYNDESNWINGVLYIGDVLITEKYEITGVCDIEKGTRVIADGAFESDSITQINVPESVEHIGYDPFIYCESLVNISVDPDNSKYSSLNGVLFNKDQTEIICYPYGLKGAYTVPDGVIKINRAFSYCENLTDITIPDSVTEIGASAFRYCISLTDIVIPNSVTEIGEEAFYGCEKLENITIPNSVLSIGSGAFDGCESLISITIPDSVESIGLDAFAYCTSLESITIPDSIVSIEEGTFHWCKSLTSITIPDSVTTIGDSVFFGCDLLKDIYYEGSEEEWNKISIGLYNEDWQESVTIHYSSYPLEPEEPTPEPPATGVDVVGILTSVIEIFSERVLPIIINAVEVIVQFIINLTETNI